MGSAPVSGTPVDARLRRPRFPAKLKLPFSPGALAGGFAAFRALQMQRAEGRSLFGWAAYIPHLGDLQSDGNPLRSEALQPCSLFGTQACAGCCASRIVNADFLLPNVSGLRASTRPSVPSRSCPSRSLFWSVASGTGSCNRVVRDRSSGDAGRSRWQRRSGRAGNDSIDGFARGGRSRTGRL